MNSLIRCECGRLYEASLRLGLQGSCPRCQQKFQDEYTAQKQRDAANQMERMGGLLSRQLAQWLNRDK